MWLEETGGLWGGSIGALVVLGTVAAVVTRGWSNDRRKTVLLAVLPATCAALAWIIIFRHLGVWYAPSVSLLVWLAGILGLRNVELPKVTAREAARKRFCPECGRVLRKEWAICPYCGFEISRAAAESVDIVIENLKKPKTEQATQVLREATERWAALMVQEGTQKGEVFLIRKPAMDLGRDRDNDIVIADPYVSARHLRILVEDNELVIVDLASSNGTRVNGQPVNRSVLRAGDIVEVGKTLLVYRQGELPK
ncbi:MAG: FHA domain-containing protein [bacterium JZ-2024 1]